LAGRFGFRDRRGGRFVMNLGHVLAATYLAQDDVLYVLDEIQVGRGWRAHTNVRLVRVVGNPADFPEIRVEAEWPRVSWNRRFALVAAPDGGFWVVASRDDARTDGAHIALLLERVARTEEDDDRGHAGHEMRSGDHARDDGDIDNGWRLAGWQVGRGLLAEVQPRADARGLSYVVERRGEQEAVGLLLSELRGLDSELDEDDGHDGGHGSHYRREHYAGRGDGEQHVMWQCF